MRNHPQVGVEIKRNSRVNQGSTLPETNMAPENRPSQKETSIPTIHFQVLISFRENIPPQKPTCQCVFHEICLTRRKRPKPLMTDAGKPASKFQKFRLQKKHREHNTLSSNAQPIHSYIPSYIHPSVHPSLEIAISFKYSIYLYDVIQKVQKSPIVRKTRLMKQLLKTSSPPVSNTEFMRPRSPPG